MTSFFTPVQTQINQVEDLIRSQSVGYHTDLVAALNHLLTSGGKRIRPTMILLLGRILQADSKNLLTLAAAIELLHTATLVHDDLIDGSLLRRGIPTLNSRWTPGATVLTGDFLFARAAKLAADTNSIPVMQVFAGILSTIVNGEISQLFSSHCQIDLENYYRRIYAKTASLFEASARLTGLISPVNLDMIDFVSKYGHDIGMAFQIVDDVFDFIGEENHLGKPVGSDLRQGLVTLPVIYYIESHPSDLEVINLRKGYCPVSEDEIESFVKKVRCSSAIELSMQAADRFTESALNKLLTLPECAERSNLEELTLYITHRNL